MSQAASAVYKPLENYKRAFDYLGDSQSLTVLVGGVGVISGARVLDEEARDYFRHSHRIGQLEEVGNEVLGTGVPGILVGITFWVTGNSRNDEKAVRAGQAQLESIVATSLMTSVVKVSVARERPDQSDRRSFPSGHTSTMFASASVLSRFYGWKAGLPAYTLSVVTALARVSDDRHWLSDTAGGALVGEIIGQAIARGHLGNSENEIAILPMPTESYDLGRQGLVARWRY
ncbi:MAG: phosphatase PAP2 family protein [Bdellovibrionota bacterium]